jgi:hypothetical protein
VEEGNLARANFPRQCNDVVRDELVLVQEEKLAHFFLPPRWDDVVPDELVLLQEACASFPPL